MQMNLRELLRKKGVTFYLSILVITFQWSVNKGVIENRIRHVLQFLTFQHSNDPIGHWIPIRIVKKGGFPNIAQISQYCIILSKSYKRRGLKIIASVTVFLTIRKCSVIYYGK